MNPEHRESWCGRCFGPNPIWATPSPLWNYVMRGGGQYPEPFGGIICPTCFTQLTELAGCGGYEIDGREGRNIIWRLVPDPDFIDIPLPSMQDGRVWDPDRFFWVEPSEAPVGVRP